MARPIATAKTTLSCSVPVATKELLETKSKAYNKTMSDLVDKLIVEAFSPKSGLAKRLEADRAAASKLHTKTSSDLARALQAAETQADVSIEFAEQEAERAMSLARQEAKRTVDLARQEYSRLLLESETEHNDKTVAADAAWEGSIQAFLLQHFDCTEEAVRLTNRWLFNKGILAARDRFGVWNSCGGVFKSVFSYMYNPLMQDKLAAADLAASTDMYSVSTDVFSYLASCYDNSLDLLYNAFDTATVEDATFFTFCSEADKLYGSQLMAHFQDRIAIEENAKKALVGQAKFEEDNIAMKLRNGWTLSLILEDKNEVWLHKTAARLMALETK